MGNLALPINLTPKASFRMVGGNRSARKEPTRTQGQQANTERPSLESNPGPSFAVR